MDPRFIWNDENSGNRVVTIEDRKEEEDDEEEEK